MMQEVKAGFTLIELLVVVLIIGILAAVAMPQYTKAVEKSRATEAVTTLSSLEKAVSLWVLENGFPGTGNSPVYFLGYFRNASLSLDLPCETVSGECVSSSEIRYTATCGEHGCEVVASKNIGADWYEMVSMMDNTGNWYFHKCGYSGNAGKAACDMLAARDWETEEGWEY